MMTAIACIRVFKKKDTRDLKRHYIYFALFWQELAMRFRFIVVIFVMALFVGVISQTVFWKNDQNEKFGWFWLTGGGWGAMVSKKRISEPTRPEIGFFNSKHSDVTMIVQSSTHKVNSFMSRVPWYVDCQEEVTWGGEIIRWNWAVIGWTPSLSLATISSSS